MSEQEAAILQNVLMVLVKVAIPPLLVWAISEFKAWRKQQADNEAWMRVEWAVQDAVAAAEQLGLTDQLEAYGNDKLKAAFSFVEARLAASGVALNLDVYADAIRAMIEAEVNRQFPSDLSE